MKSEILKYTQEQNIILEKLSNTEHGKYNLFEREQILLAKYNLSLQSLDYNAAKKYHNELQNLINYYRDNKKCPENRIKSIENYLKKTEF